MQQELVSDCAEYYSSTGEMLDNMLVRCMQPPPPPPPKEPVKEIYDEPTKEPDTTAPPEPGKDQDKENGGFGDWIKENPAIAVVSAAGLLLLLLKKK